MPDAIFKQIMDTVKTRITALNLSGVAAADVVVRKLPYDRNRAYPGISICPEPETNGIVTNASDDVGYGVLVALVQVSDQDLTSNFNRLLQWRESIRQEFSGQRIAGITGASVHKVEVTPGAVILPDAFLKNYDVSALLLRCVAREQTR